MMLCTLMYGLSSSAAITKEYGWFETAAVEWASVSGAADYNVYVKPSGGSYTQLDDELVRQYPGYYRADAIGLKAGTYQMKVVPVDANGNEMSSAMESGNITVAAHDRSGFAHVGMSGGIGAYKNDGTLKDGAKVLYVWADNAKTVTTNVVTSSKGSTTTGKGLQDIIYLYQKGYEKTPLAIRIIGTIKASDMDRFDSSEEGLQVKGKNAYADMPITIEGVGFDAAFWGFGILCRNASDVEFRNFAVMLCMDDDLSLDTSNSNVWVHNMDFFYGNTGGDADQAKGDGTVDIKGKSKNITVSYNHFIDCGKTSLGGMKGETTDCWMTYHHNWFDHSDSRHPRIRTAYYHVYNNYFDGVSKYGVGVTTGGSSFVENNYFRNCKYPMLISKQGTDAEGSGTFSGENGGVIKAYNNYIQGERKLQYWSSAVQSTGAWDAVLVNSRSESVTATALAGGTGYNSSADNAARTTYIENKIDAPEQVKAIVKSDLGAGRMQHGDFQWKFNNSLQDANYGVINELKSALQNYQSTLVGFADGTTISNGGASSITSGGDGMGISDDVNDSYVPSWAGGGGSQTVTSGKYVIGTQEDYFWFNAANEAAYNKYVSAGNFITAGTFSPTREITNSKVGSCSEYIGSVLLPSGESFTAYYADGIVSVNFYVSSNGSQKWLLEKSADGSKWTAAGTVEGSTGGHPTCAVNVSNDEGIKYVRITNQASGGRDIQGIKIATYDPNATPEDPADDDPADDEPAQDERSNDATADFTLGGNSISTTNNSYTLNVAYDAADAAGYTVEVTPADKATVLSVSGATGSGSTYTIAAPAAGKTQTATFTILAENQSTTRTYTISIVKGVDPATIPVTAGEFLYFPTQAPSNTFYTVSGKYGDPSKYGSTTYAKNGQTYECTYSLKMESSTSVTFTPVKNGTVKIGMCGGYKATNLKLNGEKIAANSAGVIETTVTAGTKYTITKADQSGIFYIDLVYEGGSTPTPGPVDPTPGPGPDDPTPGPSTDTDKVYDWSGNVGSISMITAGQADGVSESTVKVNNESVNCIKFGKSAAYADTEKTTINDFYVAIKPANGTFKVGDVIHITGCINNKDTETKKGAITVYSSLQEADKVATTEDFANTYDTSVNPVEQTIKLTADCESLILTRSGNTATCILALTVVRGEASGETAISIVEAAKAQKPQKRVENGRIIIVKGDNTFNASGARIK